MCLGISTRKLVSELISSSASRRAFAVRNGLFRRFVHFVDIFFYYWAFALLSNIVQPISTNAFFAIEPFSNGNSRAAFFLIFAYKEFFPSIIAQKRVSAQCRLSKFEFPPDVLDVGNGPRRSFVL